MQKQTNCYHVSQYITIAFDDDYCICIAVENVFQRLFRLI